MTTTMYTTSATSFGPRQGRVASADGLLDLELGRPKELGGRDDGPNPEHLFAAGYAACFHGALKLVASQEKVKVVGAEVTAEVSLEKADDGAMGLGVTMSVHVPDLTDEQVRDLIERAHRVCPYSNATRGNVDVQLAVASK